MARNFSGVAAEPLAAFWKARIERQKEIAASITSKAEFETLHDKPLEDKKTVRVAGPFIVESLSSYRMLGIDENDTHIDLLDVLARQDAFATQSRAIGSFERMILENLKTAGVQQANKSGRILFDSLVYWPGHYINMEGRYREAKSDTENAPES